jgi:phosphoglycolate phosphatase
MPDQPGITLACFGLVGTLVADDGVTERAYAEAIATQGVVSGTSAFARCMAQVHRARGQAPADILAALFPENLARAQAAQLAYDRSLSGALARTAVTAIPGATEVLAGLAESGCRIGVLTTLPRRELTAVIRAAGWRDLINVALTADDVPRGFPSPDLALAAMLRVGVADVREIAMVQATGAAVECGRRAGASVVVGVLTGPHPAARLRAAGATHVVESVADLPRVLAKAGTVGVGKPTADSGSLDLADAMAEAPEQPSIRVPPQLPLERWT